jgi:hypothetical protein
MLRIVKIYRRLLTTIIIIINGDHIVAFDVNLLLS